MAVRFPDAANFYSSAVHPPGRLLVAMSPIAGYFAVAALALNRASLLRRIKNNIRATTLHLGSASDSAKLNGRLRYHPFEEIGESTSKNSGDATLKAAETSRTIIEVNSKATVMFSGMFNGDVHENIMWPDLPYATDEHGNVYLQVKSDEDILQSLTVENNFVQVIVGFDTTEIMKEIELSSPSEVDFGIEEIDDDIDIEDEDDDDDEDYDEEWIAAFEDEDDQDDSDGTLGDWAKLETMRSSHPMYFAKKLSEVASDDPMDWMEQPSDGLAIQGLLRPAFTDEHSEIQKHISINQSCSSDTSLAES